MKNKLEELWKEILSLDEIPGDANFFDLGGTSLLTYKMCQVAKEKYDINIKPIDIMTCSTLNKLSEYIENTSNSSEKVEKNSAVRNRRRRR